MPLSQIFQCQRILMLCRKDESRLPQDKLVSDETLAAIRLADLSDIGNELVKEQKG